MRNTMQAEEKVSTTATATLGELLRHWRQTRKKSQLALSLDTGVSQRHLSFVESGRSLPSRALLSTLFHALDIPLRERNLLLLASGYAPAYAEPAIDDAQMAIVAGAIDRMLERHEPHPALVLDRYWNIVRANKAGPAFFGSFIDLTQWPPPRNLLDLMFDPNGMRPFVEDWPSVAVGLLQRARREAVGQVIDPELDRLLARLKKYPGVEDLRFSPAAQSPVLPITFHRHGERFSYFSLITTVGMPQYVTAQELRIECMYPVEAAVSP